VGVITGVGDRRDEDIQSLGMEAAKIFDELIIRHDDDLRGRTQEEIDHLICQGIEKVSPSKKITIVSNELQAVDFAIQHAAENSITVFFVDNIKAVINQLNKRLLSAIAPQKRAVA
jgi:cyanophycin synthetase